MPSRARRSGALRKPLGEVLIAPRSNRPEDVERVTRGVIAPALIEVVLEEATGVKGEA